MEPCNDHSFWLRRTLGQLGVGYLLFMLAALFLSVLGFIDIGYVINDYYFSGH